MTGPTGHMQRGVCSVLDYCMSPVRYHFLAAVARRRALAHVGKGAEVAVDQN